jgi:hypothetical protein
VLVIKPNFDSEWDPETVLAPRFGSLTIPRKTTKKPTYAMKLDTSKYDSKGQLKNGLFKEYFKDGTLSCVGKYINGEKTGEWKYYLRNGLLRGCS